MMRRRSIALSGLAIGLGLFCAAGVLSQYPPCFGYPGWEASPYVLPYPAGRSYPVWQGNCTFGGHHGIYRFGYDFLMPIGTLVTAAREGVVVEIREGFADGGPFENLVKVQHDDGTIAAYSHLHSVLVGRGHPVHDGDPIGLSGNSGQTGGVPHLHFHVSACWEPRDCETLPVTFHNTDPNPRGPEQGRTYPAR